MIDAKERGRSAVADMMGRAAAGGQTAADGSKQLTRRQMETVAAEHIARACADLIIEVRELLKSSGGKLDSLLGKIVVAQ